MFKPGTEPAVVDPEKVKAVESRRNRETALDYTVRLCCANASYKQGVTAEYLVGYAAVLAGFLDEGTVPGEAGNAE